MIVANDIDERKLMYMNVRYKAENLNRILKKSQWDYGRWEQENNEQREMIGKEMS